MPATSLASAADHRPIARDASFGRRAPLSLWPEAAAAALFGLGKQVKGQFRGGWLYRLTLRGPISDRLSIQISDFSPKRLEEADNLLRGRFRFAGLTVDATDGKIFGANLPSDAFAVSLHGFDWLASFDGAGGEPARALALQFASAWLDRYARYDQLAWRADIIARRLFNLSAHGRFFLVNTDLLWRSKFFVSLRQQMQILARTAEDAPEGLPRIEAAAGLALGGICLGDAKNIEIGLTRLQAELSRQFLPDGGHIGRAPESLLVSLKLLAMLKQAMEMSATAIPEWLHVALDRTMPMLRFFRMGDGALAVFNSGAEGDARLIATLLGRGDGQARVFGHATSSGYQRMAAGRTIVMLDAGGPPPKAFSTAAHAGCLAFEMSVGEQRMIVNCGVGPGQNETWNGALRATAAHSTLTLADTSSGSVLPPGWVREQLGPRLIAGPGYVESLRTENAQGIVIQSKHYFYRQRFGIVHERRLVLSGKGLMLAGADRLMPVERRAAGKKPLSFAIRFHVHPEVRLSLAQGGNSVILKLPGGDGWRFRCGGGTLAIEESVYLGGGSMRRTEQLVVSGEVAQDAVECAWQFEQMGAMEPK